MLSCKRRVRGGHRSSFTKMQKAVMGILQGPSANLGIFSEDEQQELEEFREALTAKGEILRELDAEILDLALEDPEEDVDEEIERADAYGMQLRTIVGKLNRALKSSQAALRRLEASDRQEDGASRADDEKKPAIDFGSTACDESALVSGSFGFDLSTADAPGEDRKPEGPLVDFKHTDVGSPSKDSLDESADGADKIGSGSGEKEKKPAAKGSAAKQLGQDWWRQLKPVTIPTFKGEKTTYAAWRASFMACIDQAPMSDEFKLLQLRQYLAGDALKVIESLGHSSMAYEAAKDRLDRKYGGERRVVARQLCLIQDFTPIKSGDAKELERLADLVDVTVINLTEAKRETELGDGLLYATVLKKIPESLGTQYQRWLHERGGEPSLQQLRVWLNREAEFQTVAHEAACGLKEEKSKPTPKLEASPLGKENFGEPGSVSSGQCLAISLKEAVQEISKLKELERKPFARKHGLCFNCLSSRHAAKRCRSTVGCKKCGRRHHTLLHMETSFPGSPSAPVVLNSSVVHNDTRVFLMTAMAPVKGCENQTQCRMFFDLGSQGSFVSESLVTQLKPNCVGRRRIELTAFEGTPSICDVDVYELILIGRDGSQSKIHAMQRPDLQLNIPSIAENDVQRWKDRGVALADGPGTGGVHLLIGADYANNLLHEHLTIDGENAWRTPFGWVLSGASPSSSGGKMQVTVLTTCMDVLWEMEQPAAEHAAWPVFPMAVEDGRYKVGLLWRGHERPEDNRKQAFAAAEAQLRRLQRSGGAKANYDQVLREYAELGAVEVEPEPEEAGYYLPHHAVHKAESSTTKTRVVFNASAAQGGRKSLNDLLDPGPSLLPDLAGMLIRFREQPVGVQADIRKAFFMIGMDECDRRYLRFVWPNEEGVMTTYRLSRLPFGVSCSPFILTAVLRHHLDKELEAAEPECKAALQLLQDSLYVDDCIASLPDVATAQEFRHSSQTTLEDISMDLRKWHSNRQDVADVGVSMVLGAVWDSVADTLCFPAKRSTAAPVEWTKRSLLKLVASLYDPLGLVAPYALRGKILLQELWKVGVDWDEELSLDLSCQVTRWWGAVDELKTLRFPRWLGTALEEITLHLFTDASERAYGCCVYAVWDGKSQLVFAKTKVSPTTKPSIARLELQAAFIGARWLQFVVAQSRLAISGVHAWTDSMTTLHWIRGKPYQWKSFVANRVSSIQEICDQIAATWHHCPGVDNPADLASRGCNPVELAASRWTSGPEWLASESMWPVTEPSDMEVSTSEEARVLTIQASVSDPWWTCFSKWSKVVNITRCMISWRYKKASQSELTDRAERTLLRIVQRDCFPQEVGDLQSGKHVPFNSRLSQFQPFLDEDGLLRATRRLQFSDALYDEQYPILLSKHVLTELMLRQIHEQRLHQGVEGCIAFVQHRFHILSCRRILRSIKARCVVCRRHDAPVASELAPPLPADRATFQRPFQTTGVDHAGPLMVKDGVQIRKAWILLFVCAAIRAVHLELVPSTSAEEFLLAYRRFVARFGRPSLIRSDNGPGFVAASQIIDRGVDWKFNPPASPWHGGFYERLVGVVKAPLRKVLGRSLLRWEELATIIAEVEFIVNERPLTYVGDGEELPPLTPNMLLGISASQTPSQVTTTTSLTHQQAARRLRYLDRVRRDLSSRWHQEYLLSLRAFHQHKGHTLNPGDVVLVMAEGRKRSLWKMAVIAHLFTGKDGRRRVARLRIGQHEFLRPVQRLVPLEVSASDSIVPPVPSTPTPPAPMVTRTRVVQPPRRYGYDD